MTEKFDWEEKFDTRWPNAFNFTNIAEVKNFIRRVRKEAMKEVLGKVKLHSIDGTTAGQLESLKQKLLEEIEND